MANFCSQCGSSLNPQQKFCPSCGSRINAAGIPEGNVNPQPQYINDIQRNVYEKVLYCLMANLQQGIFSLKSFALVFTDKNIVFARITNEDMKMAAETARNEARASGKGVLGRFAAVAASGYRYSEKYYNMTTQQILAENAENFILGNNIISQIKFKAGKYTYDNDNTSHYYPGTITIQAAGSKYKFTLQNDVREKDLRNLLSGLFGSRFKTGIF